MTFKIASILQIKSYLTRGESEHTASSDYRTTQNTNNPSDKFVDNVPVDDEVAPGRLT